MVLEIVQQSSVSLRTAARHLCRQDVHTHASGPRVSHKWAKCENLVNLQHILGSLLCPVCAYRRMLHVAPTQHKQQAFVAFKDGTPLPPSYLGS